MMVYSIQQHCFKTNPGEYWKISTETGPFSHDNIDLLAETWQAILSNIAKQYQSSGPPAFTIFSECLGTHG